MKKYFVKLMSRLLHSTIHQVMWYFWVFIVNPFSLLWSIFFSRKLCFFWSPCLLLIAESISLDILVHLLWGFSWKCLLPIEEYSQSHLMNLIQLIDSWRADDKFSWNNFYCCKRILIWQKILEVFCRIYLNIIFWMLLWMLTSLAIWNLNITLSTTLQYCYK